jgi:hypothetical protein
MINGVKRRWTLAAAALALGVCAVGVGSLAIDSKVNASAPSDSAASPVAVTEAPAVSKAPSLDDTAARYRRRYWRRRYI